MNFITIVFLAYIQNISFTMMSRSRNRDSMAYHLVCAVMSNSIWFLTMRELVHLDMVTSAIPFYVFGTVAGSLTGAKVSMFIEQKIGATSDSHINAK